MIMQCNFCVAEKRGRMRKRIKQKCYCRCCNRILSKDEIAINRKLLDVAIVKMFCVSCLASFLEVTEEDVLDKIDFFKENGCSLFQ